MNLLNEQKISAHIMMLHGNKVMLDSDLASIYGVETKVLNQAVKRNIQRFPKDFMYQLTETDWKNLRSHFVTASWGGRRTLPYVFTEHGAVMLASVINSPRAIEASIKVVRAFVELREYMNLQENLVNKIFELEEKFDAKYDLVFEAIKELASSPGPAPRTAVGFKTSGA